MTRSYPLSRSIIACVVLAVALSCSTSALAQQRESEPNDDRATADAIANVDTVFGRLATVDDVDVYRFEIPRSGAVRARVTDVSDELRVTVKAFDASGDELERGTSSQLGRPAEVDIAACEVGVYYVSVEDVGRRASQQEYRLVVTYDTADVYECNPGITSAAEIALGDTIRASLRPDGDQDYYRVSVPRAGVLTARVFDVPAELTARIQFFDAEQEPAGSSRASADGRPAFLREAFCPAGDYFVRVYAGSSFESSPELYALVVRLDTTDRYECNDTPREATPIARCDTLTVTLASPNDQDYFVFDAVAGDSVTLRAFDTPGDEEDVDMGLAFLDAEQVEIASARRPRRGAPVRLPLRVQTDGRYYALVRNGRFDAGSLEPFRVVLEGADGCGTSSLRDVETHAARRVFPNPVADVLNVELPGGVLPGDYVVEIRNQLGQVALVAAVTADGGGLFRVGVASLPAGGYVATVVLGSGEAVVARFAKAR